MEVKFMPSSQKNNTADPLQNIYFSNYIANGNKGSSNLKELRLFIFYQIIVVALILTSYILFSNNVINSWLSSANSLEKNQTEKNISTSLPYDNIYQFEGHSYQCFSDVIDWKDAEQVCEDLGGHLLTITSEEEQKFVEDMIGDRKSTVFSMGLYYYQDKWMWITGEDMTYERNISDFVEGVQGLPDLYAKDLPYGVISFGNWKGVANPRQQYICEWDYILTEKNDAETEENNKILLSYPDSAVRYDSNYYQLYDGVADSWEEASLYCENLGGHLAVINDAEENDFLYSYVLDQGYESAYLGLYDADNNENWSWADGSTVNYTNWARGEPSSSSENYGMFYYRFKDGTWNDARWGDNTTAFLCEWDNVINEKNNTGVEEHKEYQKVILSYPDSAVKYDSNYYQLYDGVADSWEEASWYCKTLGGHLAVINDAEENDFLYSYMIDQGYNSAYFGLYDTDSNGNWAWVDGSAVNYANWASGEPSSSSENYGMFYHKFKDGTWNDAKWSDNTTAFLCEWNCGEN